MGEGGTSGFCRRSGSKCGRWNPTAEQLKLLSQLFASGLRTPSTGQIRKISALLSFYGHVESKNVFYWFQNHKARERRKLTPPPPPSSPMFYSDTDNRVVPEPERVMETLQLFPVGESSEAGELRMHVHCRDDTAEPVEPPPLDLRLSFL